MITNPAARPAPKRTYKYQNPNYERDRKRAYRAKKRQEALS